MIPRLAAKYADDFVSHETVGTIGNGFFIIITKDHYGSQKGKTIKRQHRVLTFSRDFYGYLTLLFRRIIRLKAVDITENP